MSVTAIHFEGLATKKIGSGFQPTPPPPGAGILRIGVPQDRDALIKVKNCRRGGAVMLGKFLVDPSQEASAVDIAYQLRCIVDELKALESEILDAVKAKANDVLTELRARRSQLERKHDDLKIQRRAIMGGGILQPGEIGLVMWADLWQVCGEGIHPLDEKDEPYQLGRKPLPAPTEAKGAGKELPKA